MTGLNNRGNDWAPCPCGKRGFLEKASARVARKATPTRGEGHLAIYRCEDSGLWHLGHQRLFTHRFEYRERDKRAA